ncbi:MAG: hypothetical protein C5B56_09785 [Proteobacteria bacterium]|nr:MAG: hypothetical protein C5B56_09785 [Pseudomonadota bacterium]
MRSGLKYAFSTALTVAALAMQTAPGAAQTAPLTEQEAHAIAVDAYLYFYPLVTMDLTRRQMTNVPAGKEPGFGPANTFNNIPAYPSATDRVVVRPNFDTLYSSAWLDLTKEPVVVSAPDTNGRYYLLPMLDMWTDVFASPGWRTTGTQAQYFLVAPAGWRPDLRERFIDEFRLPRETQRLNAPTSHVWIIGRTKTDGPHDYDAVHEIQAGFKVTPLSEWGRTATPAEMKTDPAIDMKIAPKKQIDTMASDKYFAYAAELLKVNRPHLTDEPIIARMKRIGIEPGKSFDIGNVSPSVRAAIEVAPSAAQRLMEWKMPTLARVANHWVMNTDTMGVYGNYYLKRAIVAQQGLGANVPQDAIYPLNLGDQNGRPLDGANKYVLHFDKAVLPPVDAFWSVTLYDAEGYQIANSLNRFALSSWMPFNYDPDGSLTLYFQNENPGKDKEANWLPAPKGPFNLTMRLYAPKSEALTGKWNPPAVAKTEAFMGITGQ